MDKLTVKVRLVKVGMPGMLPPWAKFGRFLSPVVLGEPCSLRRNLLSTVSSLAVGPLDALKR
jgi:hypothetical protein